MRKQELRATLARIQPDEALVTATLARVREQKERQSKRGVNTYAFTYRLAGAMCALLLLIGVGFGVGGDQIASPVADTPDTYTRTQFNDVGDPISTTSMMGEDEVGKTEDKAKTQTTSNERIAAAIEELRAIAAAYDGDWVLLQGDVQSCYFLPAEDGRTTCAVALGVDHIHDASGDALSVEDVVSAEIRFEDDAEMQMFVDAMGTKLCLLLIPRDGTGAASLQIEKYIILE